jgi:polysaccharide biosynthesis protein PslJ
MGAGVALPRPRVPRKTYLISATLPLVIVTAAALDLRPAYVMVAVTAGLVALATHRFFMQWHVMISAIVLCILFVPIARYGLPITLPFQLEPYRLLVAVVATAWIGALLVEPAVRLRPTGLRNPIKFLLLVLVASVAVNLKTIHERGVDQDVLFRLSFFASFFLVMTMLVSVLKDRADVDRVLKVLVGGGAVVSLATLVENKTGFNVFDHLHQVFPVFELQPTGVPSGLEARGSGFRVYGSAQHPLALGAALVMLVPPALYVAYRTRSRLWWAALAIIGIAALATVARTAVMMLMVEVVVLACLKPAAFRKVWWMIPPFLVAVNIAVPATVGTLKASFFPQGGLIAQQSTNPGGDASNRVADLGPGLQESAMTPILGQGWGSRLPEHLDPAKTRRILDNQWLGVLLEAGWLGVFAWGWFFARNFRLLAGAAVRDHTDHGWLLAGLAASILAFAVGMFTYDAFAFSQATLLLFILVGLGIVARQAPATDAAPA